MQAVNYPVQTAHYVKWSILKIIERRGVKWIWSSFPTKQFYLLLLAYVLPMISGYFILSTIATLLLAGSLLAMSVSTLQIIVQAEKIFSFMEYSSVFQYFSPSERKIDTKKPEELLIKRSAFPYLTFALSFCLALIMLNLSYQRIIPFEFICLISLLFTVGIFIQFQCYKSTIFILTASSRLLGWFYVFLVVFSTVLPIPHFLFHIGSSIVSIPVFLGFALKLNLMTLVQFPLQFALIAYFLYQNKWHNFYSGLGPYLLFVSWWVLCRHFFSLSSPLYLFLATFGVLMLLVVIPFLPILFLGSPIFFFFFYGLSRQFLISLCLVVVFALLLLFVGKYFGQLMETKWLNIPIDYLLLIQILVSIPVIIVGASWFASLYKPENLPVVTLTQYSEYCGPHNWVAGNMAQTQIDCLHLENRVLMASGTIERIKMHEIVNDMELSLKSLPTSIRVALTCLFGQSDAMCGHRSDMETCQSAYTGCHFQHSNKYTFLVAMTLLLPPPEVSESKQQSTNLSVNLLASNEFAQVVMDLEVGMNLEFNATFVSGMGSDHVTLRLTEFRGIESEENVQRSSDVFLFLDQFIISVTNSVAILFDVLLGYTTV